MPGDRYSVPPPRRPRDSDAPGWSRSERAVLVKLEAIDGKVDDVRGDVRDLRGDLREQGLRLAGLELQRAQTQGADVVKSKVSTYVLGIVAVVIAGLIMLAVRGLSQ